MQRLSAKAPSTCRLAVAAGLVLQAWAVAAQPAKPAAAAQTARAAAPASTAALCSRIEIAPLVHIPVGKSTVMRPTTPVARILLGNPENARAARPAETPDGKKDEGVKAPAVDTRPGVADVDVLLLAPTEVYLLGKTIGSTNVVMLDRSGVCTAFDVVVGMDTTALQSVIAQLLPGEKDLKVSAAFDSIVLSGTVSDSGALARVTDLANAYVRGSEGGKGGGSPRIVNMLEVGAPQQVMLEVKVAEVSKALLDKFGIDFARAYVPGDGSFVRYLSGIFGGAAGLTGQIAGTTGALVGGGVIGSASNGQSTSGYTGQVGDASFGQNPQIPLAAGKNVSQVTVNMQKTDGLVKVLAEPTVMAISGQTGSFLAGGKIFIPVAQTDGGGGRTITLEEKEFGVSVNFTPTVLGSGRINLRVRPEVSELNSAGVAITGGGISAVLPSFTSRKAETTVQLMDGQSFVIGGLIKNNTTTNIKAFPFLGELPIVGALFRSSEFQTDRSELVFVITPRLVKPLPSDYKLPTDGYVPPSRSELILDGKLEGQRDRKDAAGEARAPAQGGFDKESK
ncbi:type II and III secretion system protein family protein [uncultured Piscinibacter sp.]|uniref:type II and III secretion system protein family protein n=1 Tax=uncultured Piscinibacter sp. TaxID=1131835 RepID=UPI00260A31CD|nr:type II and III secretion system protein family protein [uncultured Piscinibacter sp.]